MSAVVTGLGVEAVLFDADDTLYDTRAAMHAAGAVAATAAWPDADPERLAGAGVRFRDDPEGHFAAYTRGEIEFDEMRRARLAEVAAWLDQRENGDWWDVFEDRYEPAFLATLTGFDDVRPAISALRAAGVGVGILTNSAGEYTREKLAATHLDDLFDTVCSRDTLGYGKPDPRAFLEACRRLGSQPSRTLYVGDEVATDPLGAAEAGLQAAWLVRTADPDERSLRLVEARKIPVIRSLTEVVLLLEPDAARFGPGESGR